MKLLGQGAQYRVFTAGSGWVFKIPQSRAGTMRMKYGWTPDISLGELADFVDQLHADRAAAEALIAPMLALHPELRMLLADIVYYDDHAIGQRQLTTILDWLPTASLQSAAAMFERYTELVIALWGYGLYDKTFNLTVNSGVETGGAVRLLDAGELGTSLDDAAWCIEHQQWADCWFGDADLDPRYYELYVGSMHRRLTVARLEATWGSKLTVAVAA